MLISKKNHLYLLFIRLKSSLIVKVKTGPPDLGIYLPNKRGDIILGATVAGKWIDGCTQCYFTAGLDKAFAQQIKATRLFISVGLFTININLLKILT